MKMGSSGPYRRGCPNGCGYIIAFGCKLSTGVRDPHSSQVTNESLETGVSQERPFFREEKIVSSPSWRTTPSFVPQRQKRGPLSVIGQVAPTEQNVESATV